MKRNLLLTACSAGVLIALFVAYSRLVRDPAIESSGRQEIIETVPNAEEISPQQSLSGAAGEQNVVIPPGGGAGITLYDERTGEATHNLRYEEWRPGSEGSRDEVWVKGPVLTFLLPSGMVAAVSADEGEITVDRLQKSRAGWKFGWLKGNATITLDRAARRLQSSTQPHSDDVITVRMNEVFFDLDLGQLRCDERVSVASADFEIAGSGLDLVWNQAANRVEQLTIAHGDKLVLYSMADFFDAAPTTQEAASGAPAARVEAEPPAAAAPPTQPAVRKLKSRKKGPEKGQTGYLCALTGAVRVQQMRGDEAVSSLEAESLRLMFDVGAGGGLNLARSTSRPARRGDGRIEVQWSGPLTMSPLPPQEPRSGAPGAGLIVPAPRRHVEAKGPDVVLRRGEARIHCGELEYHDESGRIWLRRGEHAVVTLEAGAARTLTASGVFIDRQRNLIELIGDVRLSARRERAGAAAGGDANAPPADMTIACAQIAEITLHDWEGDDAAAAGLGNSLRTARFVGDVRVDFGRQTLEAHELTMTFDRAVANDTFEQRLRGAQATGGVRLSAEHEGVACAWLDLTFAVDAAGDIFPAQFDGRGAVLITRGSSRLTGRRVFATLESAGAERRARGEELALRTVKVEGGAELIDPERKIGARGATILAWMEGENRLARADVHGARGELAIVHARPYTVRGEHIELRMREQTMHVDGASRLAFLSQSGLQGERRERPTKVTVAARQMLHIDGRQNVIRVVGAVEARSGGESLNADEITLTLRDVESPPPASAGGPLGQWVSDLSALLNAGGAAREADPFDGESAGRKEPIRLTAINALAKTESFERGASEPIVHSSLEAPHLEIELIERRIQTAGYTTLLLTDYRVESRQPGGRPESEMLPSDLMSGGPSQTVLKCDRGLTYLLGEEADGRRDSVLMEGGVRLVHLAGREVAAPDEAGALAQHDKEQIARQRARYTTLDCDRLECAFGRRDGAQAAARSSAGALAPGAKLTWLNASGDVQLTDRQDAVRTEVYADRLNFDHSTGRVTVFGAPQTDARVYRFNPATGIVDRPYSGKRLSIDLTNNTVQGDVSGEVRQARP